MAPKVQSAFVTLLRIGIGWHFLYEGLVKVLDPAWTSGGYLSRSRWILSDLFHWISRDPIALGTADFLNQWGLTLVGAGLMLGFLTRLAAAGGILLLVLYYLANPPFLSLGAAEGSYLFIDKNLVELLALVLLLVVPPAAHAGVDSWIAARRRRRDAARREVAGEPDRTEPVPPCFPREELAGRRALLKTFASLPFAGAFAYAFLRRHSLRSSEEKALVTAVGDSVSSVTGATIKTFTFQSLKDLKGQVPTARIGNLELSRMILGGNLIGGWAHARDLIYVSSLVKAYHHERKIFETLYLAEQCGINTILTNPVLCDVINKYWRERIGKIQFISDCALRGQFFDGVRMSIDKGAHACYVQGGIADRFVEDGKIDDIAKALDIIRGAGLPAGIGAHRLGTVKACVDAGLRPDFWMKTLHTTDYWSAQPAEEHNNIWCREPTDTIAYMQEREEPWIAFKVLAAGALRPEGGFRYAFQGGADFICVGMYDFQIVEDVNIALAALDPPPERNRPWRAGPGSPFVAGAGQG